MIKHIVMWKLKEFAEGNNKSENANIIKKSLESLKGEISEIKFIEVGININEAKQSYDVVLCSEFESMEALDRYQKLPKHVKAANFIKKAVEERMNCPLKLVVIY